MRQRDDPKEMGCFAFFALLLFMFALLTVPLFSVPYKWTEGLQKKQKTSEIETENVKDTWLIDWGNTDD